MITILLSIITLCTGHLCATIPAADIYNHVLLVQELKKIHNEFSEEAAHKIGINPNNSPTATESYLSDPYRKNRVNTFFKEALAKPVIKKIVEKVCVQEKELVDSHYVFYHGQMFEFKVLQDIVGLLIQKFYLAHDLENFAYIRGFKHNEFPAISVQAYLEQLYKDFPNWDDGKPSVAKMLLSVNLSLFGNTGNRDNGMCSFEFFRTSGNIWPPNIKTLIEDFLKQYGLNVSYSKKFVELIERYKTTEGNLLQIFIPKDIVDSCAYISMGFGIPWPTNLDPIAWDASKNRHTLISPILERYRTAPESMPELDNLQARLVFSTESLLNPHSGIQIYRYSTLTKENKRKYHAELKALVDEILIDAISQKTKPILPTPLAKLVHYMNTPLPKAPANPKALGKKKKAQGKKPKTSRTKPTTAEKKK